MKELTKGEDEIMQVLWRLGHAFVKDILAELPRPKPAYNTVSTIVRILEKKGFVTHRAYGKTHQYYPRVEKETYSRQHLRTTVAKYFGGSFENLVSFFARENKMSEKELKQLIKQLEEEVRRKKA